MGTARVGQWPSAAVAGRGRVSDDESSAAVSENGHHRAPLATEAAQRPEKTAQHTTLTSETMHLICASSQVTGLGWASVWLSRQELPIG